MGEDKGEMHWKRNDQAFLTQFVIGFISCLTHKPFRKTLSNAYLGQGLPYGDCLVRNLYSTLPFISHISRVQLAILLTGCAPISVRPTRPLISQTNILTTV